MLIPESFFVIVKCMTFNHHAYIEDAMNGFCMQKTDFPYLCIVMDDCSTDGEQEVIKKYVDEHFNTLSTEETDDYFLNLCQHKTNENCYFAVFYLKYNHYSIKKSKVPYYSRWQDKCKYVALCEGDDYWIAADKLQMQVDFLEENEEYGMCYTKVRKYVQKDNFFLKDTFGERIDGLEDLLTNNSRIPTLVVCVRKDLLDKYSTEIRPSTRGWLMGDYPMWLFIIHETKVKFIDSISGVYRILEDSASHSHNIERQLSFIKSYYDIKLFFAQKYNVNYDFKEKYNHCVFNIYINQLIINYNIDCAKNLRKIYKDMKYCMIKDRLYYYFSYNIIMWRLLIIVKKLFLKCK